MGLGNEPVITSRYGGNRPWDSDPGGAGPGPGGWYGDDTDPGPRLGGSGGLANRPSLIRSAATQDIRGSIRPGIGNRLIRAARRGILESDPYYQRWITAPNAMAMEDEFAALRDLQNNYAGLRDARADMLAARTGGMRRSDPQQFQLIMDMFRRTRRGTRQADLAEYRTERANRPNYVKDRR